MNRFIIYSGTLRIIKDRTGEVYLHYTILGYKLSYRIIEN
jgi:hypothetical protein